jgi:DNA-binding transcriptional ArsR family regulator
MNQLTEKFDAVKKAASVLRAINNPKRQEIIAHLSDVKKSTVTKLVDKFEIEQSQMSLHLGILRKVGVAFRRRDGTMYWYSVNKKVLDKIVSVSGQLIEG